MPRPIADRKQLCRDVVAVLEWYGKHARDLPWRRTRDPYAIWVSEVMLQQTQVKTVIPFWERWMQEFPTVLALAGAPEERVLKLWEGLGYYRRARHLHEASRVIEARHGGRFPESQEAILALPGVGRYTAGAIGSIAFGKAVPILDGNIIRFLCRLGAVPGDPKDRVVNAALWAEAQRWVETAFETGRPRACSDLNQALMELGATVCTPRSPVCERCPVSSRCLALAAGRVDAFPEMTDRARVSSREFAVLVVEHRGRVWVRQRGKEEVNGMLWEFPNVEVEPGKEGWEVVLRASVAPGTLEDLTQMAVVRHSITRYRMTQRAYAARWGGGRGRLPGGGRWCRPADLEALPMPSAHRRIASIWAARREELHPD